MSESNQMCLLTRYGNMENLERVVCSQLVIEIEIHMRFANVRILFYKSLFAKEFETFHITFWCMKILTSVFRIFAKHINKEILL
jgi:hypothetical protein